jgi:hypothetical protein
VPIGSGSFCSSIANLCGYPERNKNVWAGYGLGWGQSKVLPSYTIFKQEQINKQVDVFEQADSQVKMLGGIQTNSDTGKSAVCEESNKGFFTRRRYVYSQSKSVCSIT